MATGNSRAANSPRFCGKTPRKSVDLPTPDTKENIPDFSCKFLICLFYLPVFSTATVKS